MKRRFRTLALIALTGLVAGACGGDASQTGSPARVPADEAGQGSKRLGEGPEFAPMPPAAEDADLASAPEAAGEADVAGAQSASAQVAPEKVIKTNSLRIKVGTGEFEKQFAAVQTLAQRLGGFVSRSSSHVVEGQDEVTSGTITIRVPSVKYTEAVKEIKALGDKVDENEEARDVGKEFVDLEARLRQLKSQEAFFLRLIDKAEEISELIQIQQNLSGVQVQIEEIQGNLQFLKDQVALATINAEIFEPTSEETKQEESRLLTALRDALSGFNGVVAGAIVALGYLAPFALVIVIGFLAWRAVRRGKKTRET